MSDSGELRTLVCGAALGKPRSREACFPREGLPGKSTVLFPEVRARAVQDVLQSNYFYILKVQCVIFAPISDFYNIILWQ